MKIIDLTEQIQNKNIMNNYVFNNSIIYYKQNTFIMTYRNIIYNVGQKIHPWKFWSEGYKYMLENHKDLILLNAELGVNYKLYDINKYRTQL